MFVTGICPTFRQPELLSNLLACWLLQDYPADKRQLIILDDAQTFENDQTDPQFKIYSASSRFPSLPAKYNELLRLMPAQTDVVLVIETDDIYLPGYVSAHVRALQGPLFPYTGEVEYLSPNEFSKAPKVLTDYKMPELGKLIVEEGDGRFHASMAFRKDLITRIGGWPDTKRSDFDQQLIRKLYANTKGLAWPWSGDDIPTTSSYKPGFAVNGPSQYIYIWHSGTAHCQSTMRSPDDETWYDRALYSYKPVPYVGRLAPKMNERTKQFFKELGYAQAD